jgi:hypothetical protein
LGLVRFGFSLEEIDKLNYKTDIRLMRAIFNEYSSYKEVERLIFKLDISEAVHSAIVGTKYDKGGRNFRRYKRWKRSIIYRINKLTKNKELDTVWNTVKRSRKLRRS